MLAQFLTIRRRMSGFPTANPINQQRLSYAFHIPLEICAPQTVLPGTCSQKALEQIFLRGISPTLDNLTFLTHINNVFTLKGI